tara:strand:+ start:2718 stop:3269 length:552 start_codon:yes stop_codon:yes gene_type:complete
MAQFNMIEGKKVVLDFSLQEITHLSHIKRWGIVKMDRSQSVAEHSYNVAMISCAIVNAIPPHLRTSGLRDAVTNWALFHDLPEVYTGDIPTPVKGFIRDGLAELEGEMFPKYIELKNALSAEVVAICKAADLIEAIAYGQAHCADDRADGLLIDMHDILDNLMFNCRMDCLGHVADAVEVMRG